MKKSELSEELVYQSSEIMGFIVGKERYCSGVVHIDKSSSELEKLTKSAVLNLVPETLFVKVYFDGPKSLYYVKDRNKKEHLLIKENKILKR